MFYKACAKRKLTWADLKAAARVSRGPYSPPLHGVSLFASHLRLHSFAKASASGSWQVSCTRLKVRGWQVDDDCPVPPAAHGAGVDVEVENERELRGVTPDAYDLQPQASTADLRKVLLESGDANAPSHLTGVLHNEVQGQRQESESAEAFDNPLSEREEAPDLVSEWELSQSAAVDACVLKVISQCLNATCAGGSLESLYSDCWMDAN